MKVFAIGGIVTILFLIVLSIIFGIWVLLLQKPTPGVNCKNTSTWVWDSSCLYFEEKFPDPSLKSPKNISPSLVGFQYSDGAGPSIFLPCWYRFRYVNVLTGGFSDFSAWTKGSVISGSCCLPCPDGLGNCPSSVIGGYESCPNNQPTIGVSVSQVQYNPTQQQSDGAYIYMNLHRYVGNSYADAEPPSENVPDEIVGILAAPLSVDNNAYLTWIDELFNPCKQGCQTPTWCRGSSQCTTKCIEV